MTDFEKFKMIWEAVKDEDKQKFVFSIVEKQNDETKKAMLEYLATIGADRMLENIKRKKNEKQANGS